MEWALAVTTPNCERIVCAELTQRLQIPHHFFLQETRIVRLGQVLAFPIPAFPRYIFVPLERVRDVIRSCWRVLGVVRFGEEIARIGQSVIDDLVVRCGGGNTLPVAKEPEPFLVGDHVFVSGYGPMSGHNGVYQQRVAAGKLCVLFDWMGRWVPIDVDQRDVSGVSVSVERGRTKQRKKRRRPGKNRRVIIY